MASGSGLDMAVSQQESKGLTVLVSRRTTARGQRECCLSDSFTLCQRVTAPDAVGVSSEFSDCPVVLCSCQRAVAVIVSNDLTKHTWYGRCCGRWLRKRFAACRFIHTFHRCRSETPSSACRFSGNHNNFHNLKLRLTSTQAFSFNSFSHSLSHCLSTG